MHNSQRQHTLLIVILFNIAITIRTTPALATQDIQCTSFYHELYEISTLNVLSPVNDEILKNLINNSKHMPIRILAKSIQNHNLKYFTILYSWPSSKHINEYTVIGYPKHSETNTFEAEDNTIDKDKQNYIYFDIDISSIRPGTTLRNIIFINTHFKNTQIDHIKFYNCLFINCTFTDTSWKSATINNAMFDIKKDLFDIVDKITPSKRIKPRNTITDSNIYNSTFNGEIRDFHFDKSLFVNAKFKNSTIEDCSFTSCSLNDADFSNSIIINTDINNARLLKININNATVQFTGIPDANFIGEIANIKTSRASEPHFTFLQWLKNTYSTKSLDSKYKEATFALELSKKQSSSSADGKQYLSTFFYYSCEYGLNNARLINALLTIIIIFSIIYFLSSYNPLFSIHTNKACFYKKNSTHGLFISYPKGGVSCESLKYSDRQLLFHNPHDFIHAIYISLLMSSRIGWRDLTISNWITRLQPTEATYDTHGWIRIAAGIQSLSSIILIVVYLVANFGKPFN
ncbi:pentapeptide repeat-containing protein [Fundidesulfovibrio terrae]|uniref:pentapeptide repeat-containing protein n=1 Tax=Fundidesulfovibrio terrae TaxID=2922866 RepID=UPI001FB02110|nr:pentapeptide repeat-containing protein [Fundidesulfovibrio terrae]